MHKGIVTKDLRANKRDIAKTFSNFIVSLEKSSWNLGNSIAEFLDSSLKQVRITRFYNQILNYNMENNKSSF